MITFLTIPRAFTGEFDVRQRMAIQSWQAAAPGAQIILFGADLALVAHELGAEHRPNLEYVANGAPLVDRAFNLGERYAIHDWLCYCSADVVLDGLVEAVHVASHLSRPFIIGRRWDIEPGAHASTATLHPPCGVDYFLYRKGTLDSVLPFTVRGGGGDQWLLWKALTAWDMTVIDATETITAIHVNHSHPEWPDGKVGRQGSAEQTYNRALYEADGMRAHPQITNTPWIMTGGKLTARER